MLVLEMMMGPIIQNPFSSSIFGNSQGEDPSAGGLFI